MITIKNSIIIAGFCILTVSCGSLGKYKHVTEVPDNLYGDVAATDNSTNIATFQWRDIFTDPALQSMIDTALVRNLDLQASAEHILQAEAVLLGAKLSYIPTLGITGSYTPAYVGDGFANKTYDYQLSATSSWQLSIFRLINNQKYAKATLTQQADYYQAVRVKLISSVANSYFTLMMLDSQLATTKQMLEAWKQSVETVIALKDAGLADQVAVNQYQANLDNMKITVNDLQSEVSQTENAINMLLSRPVGTPIVRGSLNDQKVPEVISAGVPVQMLTLRPDVRAAEINLEQAYYAKRGAILNFFPSLSINGSVGFVDPGTGALSPITQLANVGAGLVAPIFNAGKNRSELLKAKSLQREARLSFDNTLLEAGREVNDAFIDLRNSETNVAFHKSRAEALDKAREDTEYLMRNSLDKTYLDVLYAYTNSFEARLTLIANQAKRLQSVANIYSALGGGATE